MHQYSGIEFPQPTEMGSMCDLLKHVADNYRCVSPVNSQRELKNFSAKKINVEDIGGRL